MHIFSVIVGLDKNNIKNFDIHSSDICKKALSVSISNYGSRITSQLGDIRSITEKHLNEISHVDFLFGSPPCNDLSKANPNRRGAAGTI